MSYSNVEVLVEKLDKILVIKFNNPQKKNSINRTAYREVTGALIAAANDELVTIIVFTGVGEYFTAGNRFEMPRKVDAFDKQLKESREVLNDLICALIDCPKVMIALVNGPCIGIGSTLSALCDVVWCSETAYFYTPFTKLGIVPEACSSYLFSLLMGRSRASEMLLLSQKLTADDAFRANFVSRVFKLSELQTVIWPEIQEMSKLPPGSMLVSKKLLRMHERDTLHKTYKIELDELMKRFYSEEFLNALMQFFNRKTQSKL